MEEQMNRVNFLAAAACVFAALSPALAHNQAQTESPKPEAHNEQPQKAENTSRGERVFKQNCSRCHEAPQGFPAQISGTIVRHMRVRASLSAQDERALLKFLNP